MIRSPTLLAAALLASTALCAHDGASRHGGRVADVGRFHVEVVTRGADVDVFVSDGGETPVPAARFTGTAVLVVDGAPARVALRPADGNRLSGRAAIPLGASPKGAVQLTAPDGTTASGRFD